MKRCASDLDLDSSHEDTKQEVYYADNHTFPIDPSSLVTVLRGNLPLVLSAPHGGLQRPKWAANLTARRLVSDAHTLELAKQLSSEIRKISKMTPYVVINQLHRSKMDANRNVNDATEGLGFATAVYDVYHDALRCCCETARTHARSSGEALMLDIHGYAPLPKAKTLDTCWIILGHLVSASDLKNAHRRRKNLPEEDWVRGTTSLGSLLEKQGLLAEPSARQKVPAHKTYFSGGFITENYREKGVLRTIQLEFPRPMRDDLNYVVPKVALAIMELMERWGMLEPDLRTKCAQTGK